MAKKRKKPSTGTIQNRRARFDYDLGDEFVAGVVLNGRETKALRLGNGSLTGAFVSVNNGEIFVNNMLIKGTNGVPISESEQTQSRKLLLKQREIDTLIAARQQGRQIVPTKILTRGRFIKLKIAIGKSKKRYDKRQTIKKRDDARQTARDLKK